METSNRSLHDDPLRDLLIEPRRQLAIPVVRLSDQALCCLLHLEERTCKTQTCRALRRVDFELEISSLIQLPNEALCH